MLENQTESAHGVSAWTLIITVHHIIFDGWSMGLILDDLCAYYRIYLNKDTCEEVDDEMKLSSGAGENFSRYLLWEANLNQAQSLRYWRNLFDGYQPSPMVTTNPPLSSQQMGTASQPALTHTVSFGTDTVEAIHRFARKFQVTPNAIAQQPLCLPVTISFPCE